MSPQASGTAPLNAAGSPQSGGPAFLAVGKLRHAHGVHGEILMEVYTDFPERLQPGTRLYLDSTADPLQLTRCRGHREGLLLTFQGYSTPEEVRELRNRILYVKADDRPPLADGEYYHHQLLNLNVIDETGATVGILTEILETGASDVLVIKPVSGPEILVPFADEFVRHIDLERREIIVHLIPGMLIEEPGS